MQSVDTRSASTVLPFRLETSAVASWATFAVGLVVSLALALFTDSASLRAPFGPIDDHEPLRWMGPDGSMSLPEGGSLWWSSTIGEFGNSSRYRPVYYLFRIVQTLLFGDHPSLWYASVILTYALTCAVLAFTCTLWLTLAFGPRGTRRGWVTAIGCVAFCSFIFAGMDAWRGIAARLGPSELWGLFAISLLLVALTKLALLRGRSWWLLALVACCLTVFSKESFFAFAALLPITGAYRYIRLGGFKVELLYGLLGLLPFLALSAALYPSISQTQTDIYGQSTGSNRLAGAIASLLHVFPAYWLPSSAALLGCFVAWWFSTRQLSRTTYVYVFALSCWSIVAIWLDCWFYGGAYSHPRYFAVFGLVKTLQILGALCLIISAIRLAPSPAIRALAVTMGAVVLVIFMGVAVSSMKGLTMLKTEAVANQSATADYQRGLATTIDLLEHKPGASLVLVASNDVDYEPAIAVLGEVNRRTSGSVASFLVSRFTPIAGFNAHATAFESLSEEGQAGIGLSSLSALSPRHRLVCAFLNEEPFAMPGCNEKNSTLIPARGM